MKSSMDVELEAILVTNIEQGLVQETKLETDDKVLARITDGIYRLPGSAIRELISNAYDADAENVYIETDVPRFNTMTIRDDGNGMSVSTLVNMLRHIGGSAKRTSKGIDLKVTDESDNSISFRKKRKLIGKIGIGLFSVAQLTRDFEIITKQSGTDFYLRAKVNLFNYSEDNVEELSKANGERGKSFQTGEVKIWKEGTENVNAHGTDIILYNIKESAKDQLRSVDIWGQTEHETDSDIEDELDAERTSEDSSKAILPDFHVGFLSKDSEGIYNYDAKKDRTSSLPWNDDESPDIKFSKLYDAILEKTKNAVSPKLGFILDNYLNMIWTLGLSVPLEYIEKHPFAYTLSDVSDVYILSNTAKGQVKELPRNIAGNRSFGDVLGLNVQSRDEFNVVIDGIKLYRPVKFTGLPESKAAIKKPILFFGKYSPNLSSADKKDSGGELEIEAYILWAPKISPKDHNGSLIRINNASGILFDETFMKHQVAEHTIKSQLTAEIFVSKGLDSALNIDRESFNIAHPHYQIVTKWLHSAIRQVVNKYKTLKKEIRTDRLKSADDYFTKNIEDIVENSLLLNQKDPFERSSLVMVDASGKQTNSSGDLENKYDNYLVSGEKLDEVIRPFYKNVSKKNKIVKRSEAILQILDSYDLLGNLTLERQESLVLDLIKIISLED